MVPFVEAGYDCGAQDSDASPAHRPPCMVDCREGCAPGAEEQNAQGCVADDMAGFANIKVPVVEALPIHPEKKMENGIENPARVIRRKQRGRFNSDDDKPENRGDPRFENIVPV